MRDRRGSFIGFSGAQGVTVYEDIAYPNFVLLLQFNGAENSTAFSDVSLSAFNLSTVGTVSITQTEKKFGTGSLRLQDVNSSYLSVTDTTTSTRATKFNFGLGDYTLEAWVLLQSYKPNGSYIIDTGANSSSGGVALYIDSNGRIETDQQTNTRLLHPTVKTNQSYTVATVNGQSLLRVSTTNHNLNVNDRVYLQFPANTSLNDIYTVIETATANQFAVAAPSGSGTSGTVTVTALAALVGTYAQAGTTMTVTCTNHGLAQNETVNLEIITGSASTRTYAVASVADANTFTVTTFTSITSASGIVSITRAIPLFSWNHIALVRRAGVTTSYLNGKRVDQTSAAANYSLAFANNVLIGTSNAATSNAFYGNIDELLVSNSAQYLNDFTPATNQYSNAAATISGFWSQREAEYALRTGSWPGLIDLRLFSSLSLWLDAADQNAFWDSTSTIANSGNVITSDTTVVGRWQDKSGFNRSFTRAVSSVGPKRVSNEKNGLPVLRFNRAAGEYLNGAAWNAYTSSNGFTMFIVAKVNATGLSSLLDYQGTTLLSSDYLNSLVFTSTQVRFYNYNVSTNNGPTVSYTPGTWAIFTLSGSAATNTLKIALNNTTATNSFTGYNAGNSAAMSLARNSYSFSNLLLSTDVAEMAFFNTELPALNQTTIYAYLRDKWAIT